MKKSLLLVICLYGLFLYGCATVPAEVEPIQEPEPPVVVEPLEPKEPVVEPLEPIDFTEKNEALLAEADIARERAIKAGAAEYFPNELAIVDSAAGEAQTVYDAGGDPQVFNQLFPDIVYQYKTLEEVSLSSAACARINELGFKDSNPEQYAIAQEASLKTEEMFNSGAMGKDLYEESKKILLAYTAVIHDGFTALAKVEREKFLLTKEKADDIKASVASKDDYESAVTFFTQANADLVQGMPEIAYNNFVISNDGMDRVYEDVATKRARANEAIERAKNRIDEADKVAIEADTIVPFADIEALNNVETPDDAEGIDAATTVEEND